MLKLMILVIVFAVIEDYGLCRKLEAELGYRSEAAAAPPMYNPLPVQYWLSKPSIIKHEKNALDGNTSSAVALATHYALIENNSGLSNYWNFIGSTHGSATCLASYLTSARNLHDDEAVKVAKFSQWAFKKYSRSWTKEERQDVMDAFDYFVNGHEWRKQ